MTVVGNPNSILEAGLQDAGFPSFFWLGIRGRSYSNFWILLQSDLTWGGGAVTSALCAEI